MTTSDQWAVRCIVTEPRPEHPYVLMSPSIDDVWVDRLRCDDRDYALGVCEQLNEASGLRAENLRLRKLVGELLPFMLHDIEQGLYLGPPSSEHPDDGCSDCTWYAEASEWKKRVDAGEFDAWS